MDKLCLENNLRVLKEKDLFYCSLNEQDFYSRVDDDILYTDIDHVVEEVNTQSLVLYANVNCPEMILESERRNDLYEGSLKNKRDGIPMWPFYLYYDEGQFIKLIQNRDITDFCLTYRIVILVGMEEFENYFCQLDVLHPTLVLGDTESRLSYKLSEIEKERELIFGDILHELRIYYSQNRKEIVNRIFNNCARICILKNYFEPTRFKEFYVQFKEALENKGYTVDICDERGPIFRTHEILNVYRNRPDIIFQINKSRTGGTFLGESIRLDNMDNLIFINWLQDIYPEAWDKQYAPGLKNI